jgi:hypothetical protein
MHLSGEPHLAEETQEETRKREELRGLFTLSLLALFLFMRDKMPEIFVLNLPNSMYLIAYPQSLVDFLAFFWIAYAILMVFSFSDDIISSKRIRQSLKILATVFFLIGPLSIPLVLFAALLIWFMQYFFPVSLYFLAAFAVVISVVYFLLQRYRFHIVVEPRKP